MGETEVHPRCTSTISAVRRSLPTRHKADFSTVLSFRRTGLAGAAAGTVCAAAALVFIFLMAASCAAQSDTSKPIYMDSSQPIDARVDDLMKRMTLKEKIGQLNVPHQLPRVPDQLPHPGADARGPTPERIAMVKEFAAGTYTTEIGPVAGFKALGIDPGQDLATQVNLLNDLQKIALTQTRLKIPLLEVVEGTHGPMFSGATIFPEGLAIGSTFDMPLVKQIYAAAAGEARAVGFDELSTLVLELDRDPRMGRNEEAYTEDPYLYAQIAKNIVLGAQGSNVDAPDKVVAEMTDFPAQSEPVGGMERGAIEISERDIRENFLAPWVSAINAGALGVMAGYPEIDDVPEHSSEKWNTEVLRHELGFKGVVESEGNGISSLIYEDVAPDQKQAGEMALRAGVDVGISSEPAYMGLLVQAVQDGDVPVSLVDCAVRRELEQKFRLGLFEHPYADVTRAQQVIHSQKNQQLALQVARESIVLLKNENNLLPLKKDIKTIAVIGPNADNGPSLQGDYSPLPLPQQIFTILDGIKEKLPQAKVLYAKGCDVIGGSAEFTEAVNAARQAQIAVVVVGENPGGGSGERPTDGEGFDVARLNLTGYQEDLVRAIQATGTPVVMVLVNGRPLAIPWEAEHLPAIVEAWEPGERGGEAVADVLFGDYNPSGRLAISVPRDSGQLPDYYDYKPSKAYWMHRQARTGGYVDMSAAPLFPFGYGLSYTQFTYSNLQIAPAQTGQGGVVTVKMDVQNTGNRAGVQTVQLYLHERFAPVSLPVEQLRDFERVMLQPGETRTLTMTIRPADMMFLDRDMLWKVAPGTFDVMIGNSATDIALKGSFQVKYADTVLDRGLNTQPDLAR